jgi:hypothetical protein
MRKAREKLEAVNRTLEQENKRNPPPEIIDAEFTEKP